MEREGGSGFKDKRREEERTVTQARQGERDTEIGGGVVVSHGRPAENGSGRPGVGPVDTRSPCLLVKRNGKRRRDATRYGHALRTVIELVALRAVLTLTVAAVGKRNRNDNTLELWSRTTDCHHALVALRAALMLAVAAVGK